jgi:hypothetical protein
MNKSLLSELLDGAAFPAMMLAAAVSQINVSPEQGDALRQDKRLEYRVITGRRYASKEVEGLFRRDSFNLGRDGFRLRQGFLLRQGFGGQVGGHVHAAPFFSF